MTKKHNPSRRSFLGGMAAATATGGMALTGCQSPGVEGLNVALPADPNPQPTTPLPDPSTTGIEHVVVVMMENRSFDHMMGWVPNADGIQAGLSYPDNDGNLIDTYHLAPEWQGCQFADPEHGSAGGRIHRNDERMDGFLKTADVGDTFPVGYYLREDVPFWAGCVDNFTVGDRYFSGLLSQTFPNRIYMHSAETDRLTNALELCALPTIWDRCAAGGVSHAYYHGDAPITALWGQKHVNISKQINSFYAAVQTNTLENVVYIDPYYGGSLGEAFGISQDDHPFADIRDGQAFMDAIYNSLRSNPAVWEKTLLVINYDEWGGFYDHVPPPVGPVSEAEETLGNDGILGIRTPFAMLGPRVKRNHVCSLQLDPGSIINYITWQFGLEPLGARSDWSINLAHALDLDNPPDLSNADFGVPGNNLGATPFAQPCLPGEGVGGIQANMSPIALKRRLDHLSDYMKLAHMAKDFGFPVT